MLIVIALIAALAGLAIPAITRAGGFMSDDPDTAARELYASMRAARVYATTYRVNTAVVYGMTQRVDSVTGITVPVIDSYGVARQLDRDERQSLGIGYVNAYTPVQDYEAHFRKLPANSCIISIDNNYELTPGVLADGTAREGFFPVYLHAIDGPRIEPLYAMPAGADPSLFPAHVFTPSGFMEPETSPVARFTVNVALMPDASAEDRYALAPGDIIPGSDPEQTDPDGELKVPVRIELFRTTGRVKMTS